MAKYTFIIGVLFSVADTDLFAQNIPPISTDRPDQTESPITLPKNHFQMETGFSFEQTDKYTKTFSHPSILFKYGLTGSFDLRLITEFVTEKNSTQTVSGLTPVTVGFKVKIAEEKGILPTTSFLGHLSIPGFASKDFKATYYAPAFRFTMQHTLSEKFSLGYNFGAEWNGETAEPSFIYTLTTGYSISNKVGAYAELYGFAPQQSRTDHMFDCGLSYLLKQNMSADISGGFGLTENAPDYFLAIGFSFRLPN
jgi:Putative MetA-pathway of phenol degradation